MLMGQYLETAISLCSVNTMGIEAVWLFSFKLVLCNHTFQNCKTLVQLSILQMLNTSILVARKCFFLHDSTDSVVVTKTWSIVII